MAPDQRPHFLRRNYLIKQGFQARFALAPILFLTIFLAVAGVYLTSHLRETLEFHLYLPHSRLQNPWQEIWPAIRRTAAWGGGGFLLALGLWGWRRFGRLRRDLERLADWVAILHRDPLRDLPALSDREVRLLGERLRAATAELEAWHRRARAAAEAVERSLEGVRPPLVHGAGNPEATLGEVRAAVAGLSAVTDEVSVDESLR